MAIAEDSYWGESVSPEDKIRYDNLLRELPLLHYLHYNTTDKPTDKLFEILVPSPDEIRAFRQTDQPYQFLLKCVTSTPRRNPWTAYVAAHEKREEGSTITPDEFKRYMYTFGFRSKVKRPLRRIVDADQVLVVCRQEKIAMPGWYEPKNDPKYYEYLGRHLSSYEADVEVINRALVAHVATTVAANREMSEFTARLYEMIRDHSSLSMGVANRLLESWAATVARAEVLEQTLSTLVANRENPTELSRMLTQVAQEQETLKTGTERDRAQAGDAHELTTMMFNLFSNILTELDTHERTLADPRPINVTESDIRDTVETLQILKDKGELQVTAVEADWLLPTPETPAPGPPPPPPPLPSREPLRRPLPLPPRATGFDPQKLRAGIPRAVAEGDSVRTIVETFNPATLRRTQTVTRRVTPPAIVQGLLASTLVMRRRRLEESSLDMSGWGETPERASTPLAPRAPETVKKRQLQIIRRQTTAAQASPLRREDVLPSPIPRAPHSSSIDVPAAMLTLIRGGPPQKDPVVQRLFQEETIVEEAEKEPEPSGGPEDVATSLHVDRYFAYAIDVRRRCGCGRRAKQMCSGCKNVFFCTRPACVEFYVTHHRDLCRAARHPIGSI